MNTNPTVQNAHEPRLVVCVGASRGSLEDFERLVARLPLDTGMAFIFGCHFEPQQADRLRVSLAQHTTMTVVPVDGDIVLQRDHIYLVDAAADVSFEGAAVTTGIPIAPKTYPPGLDRLFGGVAQTFGARTVGIILCAQDGEGIEGFRDISDAGGLTIAQSPDERGTRGLMWAIESGAADMVTEIDYMPRTLERFAEMLSHAEGRALLASIVSSSDDVIISKTLDGVILSWNAAAQRIFGYSAEEAIGQSIELIIPPELRGEEREFLTQLRSGERIDHFETVRVAKNGRPVDVSLTISPIRDASGRIVAASKIARDIRERKRADAAVLEANIRKDEYLAMLGHELRNPLAAIQSAGEVIKLGGAKNPELAAQAVAILERQTHHMARLLDGLLDVSRITSGKLAVEKAQVDLIRVLKDAIAGGARKAEGEGIALRLEVGDEPICVQGDATRLSQIFGNLIENALKFTPKGGRISVSAKALDGQVEVVIADTGTGFARGNGEHLFEALRQGEQDLSRSHGGLGLGLALARGLVELHGGTIQAYSAGKGQGATFTVRLPRSQAAHAPSPMQDDEEVDVLRIVMIEDNEDLSHMLGQWFGLHGHEVEVASSGEAGLVCVHECKPDVVICDLGLPGAVTGFDIARALRDDPVHADVGLIALSGYSRPEDRTQSREAGFDVHLTKPVELAALQQVLDKLRSHSEAVGSSTNSRSDLVQI